MNASDTCARDYLCALDDVPDGGALGTGDTPDDASGVVVLRRGEAAWAYRNVCPHFSIPLNYEPGTFWTYDAQWVMCAHHSAMFHFEDGVCIDGPCVGAALSPVPVRIVDRKIFKGYQEEN